MSFDLFSLSYAGLWILTAVLFAAVFLLYRHFGRQLAMQQAQKDGGGPQIGETLSVSLVSIDGKDHAVGAGDHSRILVFTAPNCGPCHQVRPILSEIAATYEKVNVLIIHSSDVEAAGRYVNGMPANVSGVADEAKEFFHVSRVPVTPFFLVVDNRGVVMKKGRGSSREHILSLFAAAESRHKLEADPIS